jgi:hypothetical protein
MNPEDFMRVAVDEALLSPKNNARVGAVAVDPAGVIRWLFS